MNHLRDKPASDFFSSLLDIVRIELTAGVVSAYLRNNSVPPEELAAIVRGVGDSIARLASLPALPRASVAAPVRSASTGKVPANQFEYRKRKPSEIKASIHPTGLTSFENGRRYQMLRRHLFHLKMTPEEYRARWGLPDNYPMVAPDYSKRRSTITLAMLEAQRRKADQESRA